MKRWVIEIAFCEVPDAHPGKVHVDRPPLWDVMPPEKREKWVIRKLATEVGNVVYMNYREVRR